LNIPDGFKVRLFKDGNNVDCFVKSYCANNRDISVSLNNGRLTEYGHCLFDNSMGDSFYISSINNFSEGVKGVGSALHLTQIISMLENNIPETKLYSLGSAINFHAKLGYKSDIQSISEIKTFLMDEIAMKHYNDEIFSPVISKLEKWYAGSFASREKLITEGNEIIDDFIRTINDNKLKYDVDYNIISGIKMVLKREDVINNKECYNKLFNKFGIDYQITD
jgi:hypothetical protein